LLEQRFHVLHINLRHSGGLYARLMTGYSFGLRCQMGS
jgi:hypothetical protein